MVSRHMLHKLMIKIVKEILFTLSDTAKTIKSKDKSDSSLIKIQQDIYDMAKYTQKFIKVLDQDESLEKMDEEQLEKIDNIIKQIESHLDGHGREPELREELEQIDQELKSIEKEELEEIKTDEGIQTHIKQVIQKLSSYVKGYLQFYESKREEIGTVLKEIALHITAILKMLDIDVKDDSEILNHLKHIYKEIEGVTQPEFDTTWERTGQKEYIQNVQNSILKQIEQESAE